MRRKESQPVFKPYIQNQLSLMPARLDELIPEDHLERVIDGAVEQLYMERHKLGNFVKYNTFHQEQKKHRKPELQRKKLFRSENFPYEVEQDEFICPAYLLAWSPNIFSRWLLQRISLKGVCV